ncbi:hypothetical protein [Olivibacter sp. XZL3]|uniref:hypothetical protein n=1 Tax=Olivibacter sp. XZL3 TaxID=1735116 RepID=UPI0010657445|nr:hypothetical protein [Olivibacter sp. XZL3]
MRAHIIGVTATPLSSNAETPMHQIYEKLIVGEKIQTLIADGYLAKPKSWFPDVELNSLQTGEYG